jgi:hypothetical protein
MCMRARAESVRPWLVSGLLLAALTRVSPAELVRWSAAEGGNDHRRYVERPARLVDGRL